MAEQYCDMATWEGEIVEEEKCKGDYYLPDGEKLPGCKIRRFEPNSEKPDDAYPEKYADDGAWEVYFEDSSRVVHAWDYTGCMKPHINITRVVECRCNKCGTADDRFEYCWPEGCPYTILPPGRYRIRVPEQRVYNMEKGDKAAVNVLLEQVNDQYIQAVSALSATSSCCGSPATVTNCCG